MCNLTLDDGPECYTTESGADYRGNVATTQNGDACMKWSALSSTPRVSTESHPAKGLGEHKYCRNPDGKSDGAWCYRSYRTEWSYCDIGPPKPACIGRCNMCVLMFCADICLVPGYVFNHLKF